MQLKQSKVKANENFPTFPSFHQIENSKISESFFLLQILTEVVTEDAKTIKI